MLKLEECMKSPSFWLALLLLLAPIIAWSQDNTSTDTSAPSDTVATETTPTDDTLAAPSATANLNPAISVIGNIKGTLGKQGGDAETHQSLQLDELELVIGSNIYPGVSALVVLTVGADESAGIEEAYLSAEQLVPNAPIGGRVGIVRLPFGKANPLHPHSLPYVDTASVLHNLLGEFRGNGFEAVGLIPTRSNVFLQAQLGRWKSVGEAPEDAPEFGDKAMTLGRLWASTSLGENHEVELGASGAFGDSDADEKLNIVGLDGTWRYYLPGARRLLVQGEAIQRTDAGVKSRGYYLLGTYRPSTTYELGARYDWSQVAYENSHHESYVSLFATRFLSEATYLRLQVKHGKDRDGERSSALLAQIVFSFGPHTHALQ